MCTGSSKTVLGIDVGGTYCRAAIVTPDGRIVASAQAPTPRAAQPADLGDIIRHLATEVANIAGPTLGRTGVALPGIRDADTDVMLRANNLSWLEGTNLRELFASALQRPARLETDVNAAGLAQWRSITPLPRRFVYLSIGTGVGGAVILDHEIIRHTDDGPGHFCDLVVDSSPKAHAERAGVRGCLEAVARSGADLSRIARALAIGLHQIASIYAPHTIALGGGVIDHSPELVEHTRAEFADLRRDLVDSEVNILRAPLPTNEAGVIGAALLALERP